MPMIDVKIWYAISETGIDFIEFVLDWCTYMKHSCLKCLKPSKRENGTRWPLNSYWKGNCTRPRDVCWKHFDRYYLQPTWDLFWKMGERQKILLIRKKLGSNVFLFGTTMFLASVELLFDIFYARTSKGLFTRNEI